jgi:hypothetical protein
MQKGDEQPTAVAGFLARAWKKAVGVAPVFRSVKSKDCDRIAIDDGEGFTVTWKKRRVQDFTVHVVFFKRR